MTHETETMEERLGRLAQATEGLAPTPDFSARVMTAIGSQGPRDVASWITRLGVFTIPAAAVVAGVLTFWAVDNEDEYQDTLMVASYEMEQDW